MKTQKMFLVSIFTVLYVSKVFAQEKDSVVTLPTVTVTSMANVNSAVDKSFRKTFPKAKKLR